MRLPLRVGLLLLAALAAPAAAQGFLFSTSQAERTLSGSGGTVLKDLHKNEVAYVDFAPCPVISAEKWSARTSYQTMAGDSNADGYYWDPQLFGAIDALVHLYLPGQMPNPRSVFWSPAGILGTNVSGVPGMRPGDTGRIIGSGGLYGQVQYFLTADQVQQVLGLPAAAPIVVDVDAIAADPAFGIFFSLDSDLAVATNCGTTFVRDGDVLMIPPNAITWTQDLRVAAVVPGCCLVPWTEAQMDQMVQNAQITDANGNCVNAILDLESLDIHWAGRTIPMTFCSGTYTIPSLYFSGQLMTGASILTTENFGMPANLGCGPLARTCGNGATLGDQLGLLPPSGTTGVGSYVSALDTPFFTDRFLLEPQQHVIPVGTPVLLDLYTPLPVTLVAVEIVGPVVAPHAPMPPFVYYPDLYVLGNPPWSALSFTQGFQTIATPNVPFPLKLVFQAGGIQNGNIVLGAAATVDVQ